MVIVGLTGSIGMGKSTIAARLRERGIGVFDADAEVHRLYLGRAVPLIEAAFPGTTGPGGVDRAKLAAAVMSEPGAFARLEAIVHPLVREAERDFLHAEHRRGATIAVLEIPLLFESGADRSVDVVIVASAPLPAQRERVLARPGMTSEKLDALLARQTSEEDKRRRADFIVDTGGPVAHSLAEIDAIVVQLQGRAGQAFERFWQQSRPRA